MSQRTPNEFISLWLIQFSWNCLFDSDYGFMAFLVPPYTIELWHYFAAVFVRICLSSERAHRQAHTPACFMRIPHKSWWNERICILYSHLMCTVYMGTHILRFVHVYLFTRYFADAKLFIFIQRDKLAATAHCRLANFTCLQITILLFYAEFAPKMRSPIRNAAVGGANHIISWHSDWWK